MKELKEFTEKEWDLFCDALAFADQAARRDFLDRACAGDATLRKQIEELLVLQPQVDRFSPMPLTGCITPLPPRQAAA